jgi:hypothetical protein
MQKALPRDIILLSTTRDDIMQSDPKKLMEKNAHLNHSELMKVVSHVQREQGEWIVHTLMVEGCDVPFKFKRQGHYQSLKGARVNITYYPEQEVVAGIRFEVMKVVRIKKG